MARTLRLPPPGGLEQGQELGAVHWCRSVGAGGTGGGCLL